MNGLVIHVTEDGYLVSRFVGGLDELQTAVGGFVEPIPTDDLVTMWVNEDGKFTSLPVNRLAMDVWLRWDIHRCQVVGGDYLVGSCVVTGGVGADGETRDLPDVARRWVLTVARDAGATIEEMS